MMQKRQELSVGPNDRKYRQGLPFYPSYVEESCEPQTLNGDEVPIQIM